MFIIMLFEKYCFVMMSIVAVIKYLKKIFLKPLRILFVKINVHLCNSLWALYCCRYIHHIIIIAFELQPFSSKRSYGE